MVLEKCFMSENENAAIEGTDETTIAPHVLVDITRLAALDVDGVSGLAPVPGGVNRLFKRGAAEGVQILIENETVTADIYLILEHHTNIRTVGKEVQAQVARALSETVGMHVGTVNIHVEDFSNFKESQAA